MRKIAELTTQELKTYDKYFVSYGEKNAYISKESINKIWNCVLSDNDYIDTLAELHKNCGEWLKYIINTFLESYDLTSKTIIPFATSGGSAMGETNEHLASSCKGAKLIEGKVFNHSTSHKELVAWVDGLRI